MTASSSRRQSKLVLEPHARARVRTRLVMESLEKRYLLATWPLDTAFNYSSYPDGHVVIDGLIGQARAVAIDEVNDKIYIAGYAMCEESGGVCASHDGDGYANWAIARIDMDDGTLDSGWDNDGILIFDPDGGPHYENPAIPNPPERIESINAIAIESITVGQTVEQRVVVAGTAFTAGHIDNYLSEEIATGAPQIMLVMRFELDGDPDLDFGGVVDGNNGGAMRYIGLGDSADCGYWRVNEAKAMVLDPPNGVDPDIVVVGSTQELPEDGVVRSAVARLNADGELDSSFSEIECDDDLGLYVDAMRIFDFGDPHSAAHGVGVLSNHSIVTAGYTLPDDDADDKDFAMARFDSDGDLVDTLIVPFDSDHDDLANDLVLQSLDDGDFDDNDYVVAGGMTDSDQAAPDFAMTRIALTSGGLTLDTSFASSGKLSWNYDDTVATGGDDVGTSVILHDDNKPLIGGFTDPTGNNPAFFSGARFESDGDGSTPDCGTECVFRSQFQGGGTARLGQSYDTARQADGKTVVVGFHTVSLKPRFAAIRLCEDPETDCNSRVSSHSRMNLRPDVVAAYDAPYVSPPQGDVLIRSTLGTPSVAMQGRAVDDSTKEIKSL